MQLCHTNWGVYCVFLRHCATVAQWVQGWVLGAGLKAGCRSEAKLEALEKKLNADVEMKTEVILGPSAGPYAATYPLASMSGLMCVTVPRVCSNGAWVCCCVVVSCAVPGVAPYDGDKRSAHNGDFRGTDWDIGGAGCSGGCC